MILARLSEEEELFRASLAAFVAREITPHVGDWEAAGTIPRSLFRQLGELGFLGHALSEEVGGSGLDFRYTAIFVEELMRCGAVGVPVSLLAHVEFATKVIDHAGSAELKERFVRPAGCGEAIGALAITEPDAGSDVAAIRTRATRDGDNYVINGAKLFITNGTICDFYTLAARTGPKGHGGLSLIVVPRDAPGRIEARRLEKIGTHASDTAEVVFEDCRVPASHLVGRENGGFELIMQGFEGERLVLAVIACAQMRRLFEEARRYGHERSAFGRPLLGFQVWQHRLADVLATIAAAEALTGRAIDLYVAGAPCHSEISMAKLFAAEAVAGVLHHCQQIFGGMGYMEETPIARLARDSLGFTVGAGTSEMMREIIARTNDLVPEST